MLTPDPFYNEKVVFIRGMASRRRSSPPLMLTPDPFYNEKVVFIRVLASLEGGVVLL